jgi:hypothetical protein
MAENTCEHRTPVRVVVLAIAAALLLTVAFPANTRGQPADFSSTDGIPNIAEFLQKCPTNDPMYSQFRSDFEIRREGAVVGTIACTEPVSAMPIAQYTDELIAAQTLRTIYYMEGGRSVPYPWTAGSYYDWLKSRIGGIDVRANNSHCCEWFNGKWFVVLSSQGDFARDGARRWTGISERIAVLGHETRHVDGFPHVGGCPLFPTVSYGCDQTYDENNLSPYGIQWWLNAKWLSGELNVGYSCLEPNVVAVIANGHLYTDNNDFGRRFVDNSPPVLTMPEEPGGPCPGPAPTAPSTSSPTPSPTPIPTPTLAPTPTPTPTPTSAPTLTPTPTPTPSLTPTPTPSLTPTPTPPLTPTTSPTPGLADTDRDGYPDAVESACGSVYVLPSSVPERTDGAFAGVSDDGDVLIDEALPPEASGYDCDRDGWMGDDEELIFGEADHDQDPCGGNGWPADLDAAAPFSDNRIELLDVTSFLAPVRRINTNPGDPDFSSRWDLAPGKGLFSSAINIQDITTLTAFEPPMLGVRAFDGPSCPYPP